MSSGDCRGNLQLVLVSRPHLSFSRISFLPLVSFSTLVLLAVVYNSDLQVDDGCGEDVSHIIEFQNYDCVCICLYKCLIS